MLDNVGYTEQAGEKPLVADPSDARLDVFPGEPDRRATTTTQQRGVKTVQATAYGNTITYTPEDRAAARARRRPDHRVARRRRSATRSASTSASSSTAPITTDHVNLVQPLERRPQPLDHEGASSTFDGGTRS